MTGRMTPIDGELAAARVKDAGQALVAFIEALERRVDDGPWRDVTVDLPDDLDPGDALDAIHFIGRLVSGVVLQINDRQLWIWACDCCPALAVYPIDGSPGEPGDGVSWPALPPTGNRAQRRAQQRKRHRR